MRLVVIGAGGHAKVVIDAAVAAGHEIAAVVDETGRGGEVLGHATVPTLSNGPGDAFVVAIGDNAVRRERYEHYIAHGLVPATVVHPSATVAPSARIGSGSVVFAGVVVNADAIVGENAILNTGCTVDHDCDVGAHVHVAPGANLCGGVTVGQGALVGVGACVVPGGRVGAGATVGAGAAVIEPVADGAVVAGVPARER
jgi:sugar O-acyltransferase (sialic acid O-acetyltransferase NeuD family)